MKPDSNFKMSKEAKIMLSNMRNSEYKAMFKKIAIAFELDNAAAKKRMLSGKAPTEKDA
jgi:hypothetical protein